MEYFSYVRARRDRETMCSRLTFKDALRCVGGCHFNRPNVRLQKVGYRMMLETKKSRLCFGTFSKQFNGIFLDSVLRISPFAGWFLETRNENSYFRHYFLLNIRKCSPTNTTTRFFSVKYLVLRIYCSVLYCSVCFRFTLSKDRVSKRKVCLLSYLILQSYQVCLPASVKFPIVALEELQAIQYRIL